ncbi:hypothetical protein FEDK69T_09540 [Flavobacterium enshiense DK69]|uniref:Metallo-beta-lactamase domain-containing protein n=1 Tax=Flavobacterium enshiense DK69 TaxID=1107311 RepID=V6SD26_9FLAO|nr:MBL fold metallo-hydrolase [Flavobacterium enshiense]ESU24506.1 hypothetical protein FEDK69T_09540 [Flavobacterium enshiense DK69]KGO93841.1 hypothetical protein Q767_14285 [Flavobacterium enshiense DK69]
MKKKSFLIIIFFTINSIFSQSYVEDNYYKALELVNKSLKNYNLEGNVSMTYDLTSDFWGHYQVPYATTKDTFRGKIIYDKAFRFCNQIHSLSETEANYYIEKGNDSLVQSNRFENKQNRSLPLTKKNGALKIFDYKILMPQILLAEITEHPASLQLLGTTKENGKKLQVISYVYKNNYPIAIYINSKTFLVAKIEKLQNHQLIGDNFKRYSFEGYKMIHGKYFPQKVSSKEFGFVGKEYSFKDIEFEKTVDTTLFNIPADYKLGQVENEMKDGYAKTTIISEKYGDKIHLLKMPEIFSYVMIVEFSDYLAVIGAPLNSTIGKQVVDEASKLYPDKKIKYLIVGHHHFWSISGIRPFVNRGVSIVCYNDKRINDYVGDIAQFKYSQQPDEQYANPQKPIIVNFDKEFILEDSFNKLAIHNIGMISNHTEDYSFVYIPGSKLIIDEDILMTTSGKEIAKPKKREVDYINKIKSLNLDVENIICRWGLWKNNNVINSFKIFEERMKLTE